MSITDELRNWWVRKFPVMDKELHEDFTAIADRIDAEAEDNERFRREAGPFCDRLREAAAECADVTLFGVDYIALPVDADGVPIRVGDVLTDGEYTFVVGELAVFGDGSWSIRNDDGNAWEACDVTHHHEPTVEDVLREFSDKVCNSGHQWGLDAKDTIAEYATKLRLAGDAE